MAVTVQKQERPPVWRNVTVLKWVAQIVVLLAFIAFGYILARAAGANFRASGISFGWDWLSDPFGVNLREGIDTQPDSGARALVTGIVNTMRVAISGIIAATIIGTLIGIARLSKNWIINKLATGYIETIRNIPLLVQIIFWSALVTTGLDSLVAEDVGAKWFHASNKGMAVPWGFPADGFWPWMVFVIAGIFVGRRVARRRRRYMEETGHEAYSFTFGFLTVVAFGLIGWFAHPLIEFLGPLLRGIGSLIRDLPGLVISVVIAAAALLGAGWWIRNFFESRRTPAGFGKLTDDDIFRVVFAALAGVSIAGFAFFLSSVSIESTTGDVLSVAEFIRDGIGKTFTWLGDKFRGVVAAPIDFQRPEVELRGAGFVQYGTTGIIIFPPFFAMWVGVTLYTAAFIAEIVRGGILAVSMGQTEAASALGMRRSQYLRLIILPQAFRIILPPMGNQYLNLAKNTSLGIAVAFSDIVQVGFTAINQTGQSLPVVLIWMAFFTTLSLSISAIVNYYNRKLKLVER